MEARERGQPIDAGKESLIEARDHLIIGLHRFQKQVLTQAG